MGSPGGIRSHDAKETYGGGTSIVENNLAIILVDVGTGGARGHVESTRVGVDNVSVGLG